MATTLPALVPCERCNIRYAGYMETESAITALSALAQATRLETFRLLVRHEPEGLAAGDIARSLDVPQNTMSAHLAILARAGLVRRSEEHTSELQSLMRISYAGFCLKNKTTIQKKTTITTVT